MAEDFDINKEYEKIFGIELRENIFSSDDEEYQNLRQSIIEAKKEFADKKSLPFDGIKLYPYEEYLRNEIVREAEAKGYRIFYIQKYVEDKLSIYAAGYFDTKDSRFVVLKGACFRRSMYFVSLTKHIEPIARMEFTSNYIYNNGILEQKNNWTFDSASLAASYILGKKSSFKEWKNTRGKTLDAYYVKYKSSSIYETEDKTFPNYISSTHSTSDYHEVNNTPKENITKRVDNNITDIIDLVRERTSLLFFIKKNTKPTRFCDAFGTYDKRTQKFKMKSGSILALEAAPSYNFTPQGIARRNFLKKFCSKETVGYILKKDYLFDSPSAAASYAIGSTSSGWSAWKNKNGDTLADVYR